MPAVEMLGLREIGVAAQQDLVEAATQTGGGGCVERLGSAFVGWPIAGTIDDAQDLTGVGQGDDQGMVTPDAVVGDVHAEFALAGRGHERAISVEDGQAKEAGGLVPPNADADIVIDILQSIDVGFGEAPTEIAGGGWIRDALGAQSVEIIDIVASQLDVLQTIAVAQGVGGEVEHMVGFGVRETNLENGKVSVDGVYEAYVACQFVEERDTAIAQTVDTSRDLIAEIAAGQDRAGLFGKLGFVKAALDFALAGNQLSA